MYHVFSNVIQVRSQLPGTYGTVGTVGTYGIPYKTRTVGTYGTYGTYGTVGTYGTSLVTIARQPIPDPELAKEKLRMRMRPA